MDSLLNVYFKLIKCHYEQDVTLLKVIKSIIWHKVEGDSNKDRYDQAEDKRIIIYEINRIGLDLVKLKELFYEIYTEKRIKYYPHGVLPKYHKFNDEFVNNLKKVLGNIDESESEKSQEENEHSKKSY